MKAPLIHVAGLLFNEPLAILPEKLKAILHAIGPRLVADESSLDELMHVGTIRTRPVLQDDAVLFSAQIDQQQNGDNAKPYRLTQEGVAVIPVRGTLMKRFSFLSAVSGCSTYQGLAQAATAALADPMVKGVMFDVDSPGGSTHGCFELCDTLYEMRGEKPMWACANDLAASAAYALASATDRIYLTRTAGVGSVGVFALHADQSAADAQVGVKYTYVFAGEHKTDGNPHEPLSKNARADIQAEVDREYDMFVAAVARNRGFAKATVANIRGTKAGVYFAENATPLLADEVATFDEAMEAMTQKVSGSKIPRVSGKVALLPEAGNTVRETQTEKGEAAMPKPGTEEKRASAEEAEASAAAAPRDDEDEDDKKQAKPFEKEKAKKAKAEPPAEECDDDAAATTRRAPVAQMPANNSAKQIAEMCQIAGAPELAAEYIVAGHSLEKVIEKLNARRAKASAAGSVNSFVGTDGNGGGGQASVDHAIEQARVMSANSGGKLTQSQCMERILRGNPEIYSGYLEERGRVAAQVAFTGGGRALTDYVLNNQRRYMANLGLGTTIDDVPGRRPM